MKITIQRIDKSLPLPKFQTPGAVAFDIYSRIDYQIPPNEFALLPTNLIVKVPAGYFMLITHRSSTPRKLGLISPGIGVIDQDYCGPEDEIMFQVYNLKTEPVKIEKGQRIGQALLVKITTDVDWDEVEIIEKANRGGFGSTG